MCLENFFCTVTRTKVPNWWTVIEVVLYKSINVAALLHFLLKRYNLITVLSCALKHSSAIWVSNVKSFSIFVPSNLTVSVMLTFSLKLF